MFLASKTYEKPLRIEKTRLSHQVWSHGGSTFKKRTLNGHFSRPAQTDPYGDFSLSLESSEIRPVPAQNQVKRKNKSPSQRTRDSRRRTNLLKKEYAPNTSPSASLTDLEIPPLITQGLPVSVSRDSLGYQQN